MPTAHLIRDNGRLDGATTNLTVYAVHVGRDINSDPEDITDLPAFLHRYGEQGIVTRIPSDDTPSALELAVVMDDGVILDLITNRPDLLVVVHDIGSDIRDTPGEITDLPAPALAYARRGVSSPASATTFYPHPMNLQVIK